MFRRTAQLAIATAAIAAAAMIAACGSGSPSSPSSGGRLTQAQIQQDLVRFVGCMRSHRVRNLPDPITSPREFKDALGTTTPTFQSAANACQHLLPGGRLVSVPAPHSQAQIAAMLAFARCMRSHGFPNFPDPTSTGLVSLQMLASAGINLQQPAVLPAADACVSVTHGMITKADVARVAAGQTGG
jgi:hypothetical protein